MDIYKLKFTVLQQEIFRLLCIKAGASLNQREISKLLRVSPTAVSKSLPLLEKEELIKVEKSKVRNLVSIKFNINGEKAINLKRAENLKLIYESGLGHFLENEFPGCTIILFGSYSRGEDVWFGKMDDKNSDIDIAIIGANEKDIDLNIFEKMLERKIIINFYESWDKIHKNLKNNILNGILLSGGIDI